MVQVLLIGRDAEGWKRALDTWSGLEVQAVSLPSAGIRTFEERSPDVVIVAEPPGSTKAEPIILAIRERPLGKLVPLIWVAPAEAGGADVPATSKVAPDVNPQSLVDELERHLEVQLGREPGSTAGSLAGESTAAATTPPPSTASQKPGTSGSVEVDRSAAREPGSPPERQQQQSAGREPVEGRDYVVEPIDDVEEGSATPAQEGGPDRGPQFDADESTSPADPEDATQGPFGGSSTVFPTSEPGSAGPESAIEATDIERKLDEVRHQDYFAILEVKRTAGPEEIQRAYDDMRKQFHPDAVDGRLAQSYADELREIADALTDAFAVLGDEQLRESYVDATTRKS